MTPLWLPPTYLAHQESLRRTGHLSTLTWKDVCPDPQTNEPPLSEQLAHLAASLPTESLLTALGIVSTMLANSDWRIAIGKDLQRAAARELCPTSVAQAVDDLLVHGQRGIFVHERQLLIAAKLALIYGQPGPAAPIDGEQVGVLGEILLRVNDVLAADEQLMPEMSTTSVQPILPSPTPTSFLTSPTQPSPTDTPTPATPPMPAASSPASAWAISLLVRHFGFHRNEQWRYLAPRYHELLITRAKHHPVGATFAAIFRAETGLSLEEYQAFAFLYFSPFVRVSTVHDVLDTDYLTAIAQLEGQITPPELLERCQQLYASEITTLRSTLRSGDSTAAVPRPAPLDARDLANAFLPFKQRPLVKRTDGNTVPLSLPFLQEKATVGAYWLLHEGFRKLNPKTGVRSFTSAIGALFQDYLTALLERLSTATRESHSGQRFYDERAILAASGVHGTKEKPPFDAVLVADDALVLVEMTTTSLTTKLLDSGDPQRFYEEVTTKFVPKIEQLNRAFSDLADGTWVIPDLDLRSITNVYPVLALLHPFPPFPLTVAPLHATATRPDYYAFGSPPLATTYLHPLQLVTAEEFEMLEPFVTAKKQTLAEVLQQKTADPTSACTSMSVKNYLLQELQWVEAPNDYLFAAFQAVVNQCTQILGVHQAPPPIDPLAAGA